MGIYEIPQFAKGTTSIANLIASLGVKSIIGGASTVGVITDLKLTQKISFISTGGGASLSYLGGRPLPGIQALLDRK
jgi:phosphoglycerate kinase